MSTQLLRRVVTVQMGIVWDGLSENIPLPQNPLFTQKILTCEKSPQFYFFIFLFFFTKGGAQIVK